MHRHHFTDSADRLLLSVLLVVAAAPALGRAQEAQPVADAPQSFAFALIADNPYSESTVPKFNAMINDINNDDDLAWVLHLGDIVTRGSCADRLLQARFDLFQRFAPAFIFTPGDNDWFDCVSEDAVKGYDYERLDFLRRLFFPDPAQTTGGRHFAVDPQSQNPDFAEFVENAMWVRDDIVFSTFHLISLMRAPGDPAVAERRMDAALAWIEETFATAERLNSPAVFLATHVDPWVVSGNQSAVKRVCVFCLEKRMGIDRLYPALESAVVRFGRPVVLAVGDTHVLRVDKPLYSSTTGALIENFTRVEPFGDPQMHWVRVMVDPNRPEVFSFREELVEANLGGHDGQR